MSLHVWELRKLGLTENKRVLWRCPARGTDLELKSKDQCSGNFHLSLEHADGLGDGREPSSWVNLATAGPGHLGTGGSWDSTGRLGSHPTESPNDLVL